MSSVAKAVKELSQSGPKGRPGASAQQASPLQENQFDKLRHHLAEAITSAQGQDSTGTLKSQEVRERLAEIIEAAQEGMSPEGRKNVRAYLDTALSDEVVSALLGEESAPAAMRVILADKSPESFVMLGKAVATIISSELYWDSGASRHITDFFKNLRNVEELDQPIPVQGVGGKTFITHRGIDPRFVGIFHYIQALEGATQVCILSVASHCQPNNNGVESFFIFMREYAISCNLTPAMRPLLDALLKEAQLDENFAQAGVKGGVYVQRLWEHDPAPLKLVQQRMDSAYLYHPSVGGGGAASTRSSSLPARESLLMMMVKSGEEDVESLDQLSVQQPPELEDMPVNQLGVINPLSVVFHSNGGSFIRTFPNQLALDRTVGLFADSDEGSRLRDRFYLAAAMDGSLNVGIDAQNGVVPAQLAQQVSKFGSQPAKESLFMLTTTPQGKRDSRESRGIGGGSLGGGPHSTPEQPRSTRPRNEAQLDRNDQGAYSGGSGGHQTSSSLSREGDRELTSLSSAGSMSRVYNYLGMWQSMVDKGRTDTREQQTASEESLAKALEALTSVERDELNRIRQHRLAQGRYVQAVQAQDSAGIPMAQAVYVHHNAQPTRVEARLISQQVSHCTPTRSHVGPRGPEMTRIPSDGQRDVRIGRAPGVQILQGSDHVPRIIRMGNFGPSNTFELRREAAEARNVANAAAKKSVCWNNTNGDVSKLFNKDGDPTDQEYKALFVLEEAQCPHISVPKWYEAVRANQVEPGQPSMEDEYLMSPLAHKFPMKRIPSLIDFVQHRMLQSLASPTDGLNTELESLERAAQSLLRILHNTEARMARMKVVNKWTGVSNVAQEHKELEGKLVTSCHTLTSASLAFEIVEAHLEMLCQIDAPMFMQELCDNELAIGRILRYNIASAGINLLRELMFMKRCTIVLTEAFAVQQKIRQGDHMGQFLTIVGEMGEDSEDVCHSDPLNAVAHLVKLIKDARKWVIGECAFGIVSDCHGAFAQAQPTPPGNVVDSVLVHRSLINVLTAQDEQGSVEMGVSASMELSTLVFEIMHMAVPFTEGVRGELSDIVRKLFIIGSPVEKNDIQFVEVIPCQERPIIIMREAVKLLRDPVFREFAEVVVEKRRVNQVDDRHKITTAGSNARYESQVDEQVMEWDQEGNLEDQCELELQMRRVYHESAITELMEKKPSHRRIKVVNLRGVFGHWSGPLTTPQIINRYIAKHTHQAGHDPFYCEARMMERIFFFYMQRYSFLQLRTEALKLLPHLRVTDNNTPLYSVIATSMHLTTGDATHQEVVEHIVSVQRQTTYMSLFMATSSPAELFRHHTGQNNAADNWDRSTESAAITTNTSIVDSLLVGGGGNQSATRSSTCATAAASVVHHSDSEEDGSKDIGSESDESEGTATVLMVRDISGEHQISSTLSREGGREQTSLSSVSSMFVGGDATAGQSGAKVQESSMRHDRGDHVESVEEQLEGSYDTQRECTLVAEVARMREQKDQWICELYEEGVEMARNEDARLQKECERYVTPAQEAAVYGYIAYHDSKTEENQRKWAGHVQVGDYYWARPVMSFREWKHQYGHECEAKCECCGAKKKQQELSL